MYTENIKTLYLGKSKLAVDNHGSDTLLGSVAKETTFRNPMLPDLVISGKFLSNKGLFVTNENQEHYLYITGVPKDTKCLDYFRLKGCIWSSYYQDDHRGYLFQILRINQNVLPMEIKQN